MPQALAFIFFGTTSTAGLTLFGVSIAAGSIGGSLLSLAGSLLLSTAANALLARGMPEQPDIKRELSYPTTLPQRRFPYGQTRAAGTPIATPVRGEYIYGCWLLSSRPSDLPTFKLFFDKREVALTGDAFNFAGPGATGTTFPFEGVTKIWIGRGDQTSPPAEILAEAPWATGADDELFKATDAGRDCTVLWARLDRGANSDRQERWPSTPPLVEVEGRFARVWDMRDPAQDADDPETWKWSNNQALCTLDALRTNPFRPYALRNLMVPLWQEAADFAGQAVTLKAGGTEPRYCVSGTLLFNGSEIEDLVAPLLQAGASRAVRVGGKLGIVPGVWQAPVYTLDNFLGDRSYSDMKPGGQLPNEMQVTYTSSERAYESASLAPWAIPGAPDGLPNVRSMALSWVTSPTQAMRVRKIEGLRAIQQRRLSGVAPPQAFQLIGGSVVTGAFPAPYGAVYDGLYEVESIHPGLSPQGEAGGSVAMRCPVSLIGTSAEIYAWNGATEEEDVEVYEFNDADNTIEPPSAITTTSGQTVATNTGFGLIPAIRFAFDPSPTARVTGYEWQFLYGAFWAPGGMIDGGIRDALDKVFSTLSPAENLSSYKIRVRAMWGNTTSEWVESAPVTAALDVPRYTADFQNGVYDVDGSATSLSGLVLVARAGVATFVTAAGLVATAAANVARLDYATGSACLLIEGAGGNAWTYSQAADNAAWTKTRLTVTANAGTAPDGAATADKLVEDTSTNTHFLRRGRTFASGVRAEVSVFVKASGRTRARWSASGAGITTQTVDLDLSTGVATVVAGAPDVTVTTLADGWYRLEMGFVPNASPAGFVDLLLMNGASDSYLGDGSSGVLVWGLQDGAGSYVATVASAGTRAADIAGTQGITATLDAIVTYSDGTTASFDAAEFIPGYWPTLTKTRLRSLIGTV